MHQKLTIRSPKMEDAKTVCDLVIACDIADFGAPDFNLSDLLDMWQGFDMEHNVWVIENEHNTIVGYAFLEEDSEEKIFTYGFVLPSARGTGVGNLLIEKITERTVELVHSSGINKRLQNLIPTTCEDANHLLTNHGFHPVRLFKRMGIELTSTPAVPLFPEDIKVTTFIPGQDEKLLYDTFVEVFQDHWDFAAPSYSDWLDKTKLDSFRPEWWFIARNTNGEIVGFALAKMNEDSLFINHIGVKRSYRGIGLGLAMLQHGFRAAYAKGQQVVTLGVDSDSLTGAYRLYEKAGMKSIHEVTLYEKNIAIS